MTKTYTPRFELEQASSPSDSFPGRVGFNTMFSHLEERAAQFLPPGPLSSRPSTPVGGRIFIQTDVTPRRMFYDDGVSWLDITPVGGGGAPQPVTAGTAAAEGVSARAARADHVHAFTPLTAAQIPDLPASRITSGSVPPARGGTGQTGVNANMFLVGNGAGTAFEWINYTNLLANLGAASQFRQIIAGTGLSGGGNLQADRTLSVLYGTAAGTAAAGNDSRLTNSRTPTGAAGGVLDGTYPNPGWSPSFVDPLPATPGVRTLGTTAQSAAAGNDARLSNSRTPSGAAGGALAGNYPNPSFNPAFIDTAAGTAGLRTLGTGPLQAAAGNDFRLVNAFTNTTDRDAYITAPVLYQLCMVDGMLLQWTGSAWAPYWRTRTWAQLSLASGYTFTPGTMPTPAVRIEGGRAFLNGRINGTISGTINPIATVPVGFRPNGAAAPGSNVDFYEFRCSAGAGANAFARIRAYIDGSLVCDSNGTSGLTTVSLDQISWPVAL